MHDEIIKLDTIEKYNRILGIKTLHPLVSVTDLSTLKDIKHCRKEFGFYCIYYKDLECGTIQYGRSKYDYQEGTMLFIAPGQIAGINDGGATPSPRGYVLMFHPDLLYGTSLARRMKDYNFFSYDSNEALHMSEREKQIILNCFHEISAELEHAIDKHTKQIIASTIETMLNYLDIYPLHLPARYNDRVACYTKVYITSNIPLSEQYKAEQQSRPETWKAFLRRIHKVYAYHADGTIDEVDFK